MQLTSATPAQATPVEIDRHHVQRWHRYPVFTASIDSSWDRSVLGFTWRHTERQEQPYVGRASLVNRAVGYVALADAIGAAQALARQDFSISRIAAAMVMREPDRGLYVPLRAMSANVAPSLRDPARPNLEQRITVEALSDEVVAIVGPDDVFEVTKDSGPVTRTYRP